MNSYEIDLRILFKKFYCPKCGNLLNKNNLKKKLSKEQKLQYYKELFPMGIPINLDIEQISEIFSCPHCSYNNTTDE